MAPRPNPSSYFTNSEKVSGLALGPDIETIHSAEPEWKPTSVEYLVVSCLALISLVVSLDATIFVTIIPVRFHRLIPWMSPVLTEGRKSQAT